VRLRLAAVVLVDSAGRTLLVRPTAGQGALFSRLWQFPAIETADGKRDVGRFLRDALGVAPEGPITRLRAARHAVTFREIQLEPYLILLTRLPRIDGARTPLLTQLGRLPISNATRKIAHAALAVWPSPPQR
jgi:hypothetical protein